MFVSCQVQIHGQPAGLVLGLVVLLGVLPLQDLVPHHPLAVQGQVALWVQAGQAVVRRKSC